MSNMFESVSEFRRSASRDDRTYVLPEGNTSVIPSWANKPLAEVFMGPAAVVHTDGPKKGQLIAGMFFLPPAFVTNSPFPEKYWWEAVSKVWKSGKAYMPGHGLDTPNPKPNYGLVVSTWKKIVAKLVDKDGNFDMPSRNDEESFTDQVKDLEKRASQVLKYSKTHGDEKAAKMAAKLLGQKAAKSKEAKKFLDGPGSTPVNVTSESNSKGKLTEAPMTPAQVKKAIDALNKKLKPIEKRYSHILWSGLEGKLEARDYRGEFRVILNIDDATEDGRLGNMESNDLFMDVLSVFKDCCDAVKMNPDPGPIVKKAFRGDGDVKETFVVSGIPKPVVESSSLAKLIESNLRLKRQVFRESAGLAIQEKIHGMSESQAEVFVKSLRSFSEFRNIDQFKSYLDKK